MPSMLFETCHYGTFMAVQYKFLWLLPIVEHLTFMSHSSRNFAVIIKDAYESYLILNNV